MQIVEYFELKITINKAGVNCLNKYTLNGTAGSMQVVWSGLLNLCKGSSTPIEMSKHDGPVNLLNLQ